MAHGLRYRREFKFLPARATPACCSRTDGLNSHFSLYTRVKPVLIGKYRVDNIVEANFTWVSRGSKEQFNVVSVVRSFNGRMATGTTIREVRSVRELHTSPSFPTTIKGRPLSFACLKPGALRGRGWNLTASYFPLS